MNFRSRQYRDERKSLKRIPQKNKKALRNQAQQQKSYQRNKYLSRPIIRYSGPFLKWTKEELRQIDQRTRKLMTMHKAVRPRDNRDRLYVKRSCQHRRLPKKPQSNNSNTTQKRAKTDYLWQPTNLDVTYGQTEK